MEERKLEFFDEHTAADIVREAIRHQQHGGNFDAFVARVIHAVFEMDRAFATSQRLRTSS
ncbi:MAG: hypothetical protein VB131_00705 [Burkholderia gladioli]